MKECINCGSVAHHKHHVIPKSLGGVCTVDLCTECHSKAHNSKLSIPDLTRFGLLKKNALLYSRAVYLIAFEGYSKEQILHDLLSFGFSRQVIKKVIDNIIYFSSEDIFDVANKNDMLVLGNIFFTKQYIISKLETFKYL